ncbi:TetR/AcrR family transcriptional regulator [Ammoniphilus sp. 3BR4]|uniref:TetR/AcrR family transcriptional regulator n=1 Tax=Ammoniphilus sp. 3BR4 TaxID=3158265 RepID=UPI003466D8E3
MGKPKQIRPIDLVGAAKQQLVKKGQGKITLKNVAEAAGVTQGVVYYHFKTKDQLLISLLEDFFENDLKELKKFKQEKRDKTPVETMEAYVSEESYKSQVFPEHQQVFYELVSLAFHQKEMKALFGQAIHAKAGTISEMAAGSQATGRLILAILQGLALQSLFDPTFNRKETYELAKKWISKLGTE